MSKKPNNFTVQATNNSSIHSKHSMCHSGYFVDDFLAAFTCKKAPRRAPLINRGYYIRMKAVDMLLRSFTFDNEISHHSKQIVSLGAGFDTLFFRLSERYNLSKTMGQESCLLEKQFYVVEIDFRDVALRKKDLILSNDATREYIDEYPVSEDSAIIIDTSNYCLIGADLSDLRDLRSILENSTRLCVEAPTMILSECVMTYMEPFASNSLIYFMQEFFPDSIFLNYEQVNPWDAFGTFMRSHFDKLNSSLKAITMYDSIGKQCERFRDRGYQNVVGITMLDFYLSLPLEEILRVSKLEFFDEFEEWHLKCSHYTLTVAIKTLQSSAVQSFLAHVNSMGFRPHLEKSITNECLVPSCSFPGAQQYAHASALMPQDASSYILAVHGGFGVKDGSHRRSVELLLYHISINDNKINKMCASSTHSISPRLHHTLTCIGDMKMFMFGGRLSPSKAFADPLIITMRATDADGKSEVGIEEEAVLSEDVIPRWRHSAVHVLNYSGSCVVVTGGMTASDSSAGSLLVDVSAYDLNKRKWRSCPSLPLPLHSHASCFDDDKIIYVFGGLTNNERINSKCLFLDVSNAEAQWQEIKLPLEAVYSHDMFYEAGGIITFGGLDAGGRQFGVQVCDLFTKVSRIFDLPVTCDGRLSMFFNHTSHLCLSSENRLGLIAVGGGGNCFSFGTYINNSIIFFPLNLCKVD